MFIYIKWSSIKGDRSHPRTRRENWASLLNASHGTAWARTPYKQSSTSRKRTAQTLKYKFILTTAFRVAEPVLAPDGRNQATLRLPWPDTPRTRLLTDSRAVRRKVLETQPACDHQRYNFLFIERNHWPMAIKEVEFSVLLW